MKKYYYENVLANENITAKTNIAWVADITEIKLYQHKKLYVFLCVDVHSNVIIANSISRKTITSSAIVRSLSKAIEKRFGSEPKRKVIIHTDRGTQFSSQAYNNFIKHFEAFITPSMSRENTPTDNAVAERFMRTFKEHLINGKTFEQATQESIISGSKSYKSILNIYIQSLNTRPNRKTIFKSPDKHDRDVLTASLLMREPKYPKAFSNRYGNDYRREEILKYKTQTYEVVSMLEEYAAKKAELVDKTPFDNFETNLVLDLIDKRLIELYDLIQNNPSVIQEYVENALEQTNENIQEFQDEFREDKITDWQAAKHIYHANGMGIDLVDYDFTQQELDRIRGEAQYKGGGGMIAYARRGYKLPPIEMVRDYQLRLKRRCDESPIKRTNVAYYDNNGAWKATVFATPPSEDSSGIIIAFNESTGDLITGDKQKKPSFDRFKDKNYIGGKKWMLKWSNK
jgi:transposase InsO family protein